MTNARDGQERRAPIEGVDESAAAILSQLISDPQNLSTLSLDNCDVMIMGFSFDKGGVLQTIKNGARAGETFTSQPQIAMQLRVDDIDGIPDTSQFFPVRFKSDGTLADPQTTSAYGIWLSVMSGYGISGNAGLATRFQFKGLGDLIGLKYHRMLQGFEGYRGNEQKVHVPTEFYGFDNEYRAKLGLEPAELAAA